MSAPQRTPLISHTLPRMVAGAVVGEVAGAPLGVARAEALVVAVDDLTGVIDDVEAVVGLVAVAQSVGRSHHQPHTEFAGYLENLIGRVSKTVPVEPDEGVEIGTGVTGQRPLGEVCDIRAPLLRRARLAAHVAEVGLNVGTHRELARRHRDYCHAVMLSQLAATPC